MSTQHYPLYNRLIQLSSTAGDEILDKFLDYVSEKGIELYPAQESAILDLYDDKNVILNTPTGSGKSLVALALQFKAVALGRKAVYTSPIKALVNEKFLDLCREFGPEQVGMSTGDATVNRDAPILCCTAEVLSNLALREGDESGIDDIIMDEFHYYSDRDRGVAWQVPLLTMSRSRFLLMSATLGDTGFFEEALTRLTGAETSLVKSDQRPVPLDYDYSELPLDKTLEKLFEEKKAPVYIVHFRQMECAENAQSFTSMNFCSREEKSRIARELENVRFNSPYGKDMKKYLRHGIGVHHAGLLPKYRVLVEKMAQQGMLKLICGTDTLGLGINVPIRTVLLSKLCKFDGENTKILTARDFHQVCGRAGRKGYDDKGWVVAQAPEHVTENIKMERKAAGDPKKLKKLVKKKPPDKNFVNWSSKTFERLTQSQPEPLVSRFQVTHGMLLNVLSRGKEGCSAMKDIIRNCHEPPHLKKQHRALAFQLFRSLLERNIIEFVEASGLGQKTLRLNVDLQEDFSLNHALSLYLIDTIERIDRESVDYAPHLLTLVEAIIENPDIILRRQLKKLKDKRVAEMKAEGVPYEQRMEELDNMEHPKPLRDFIYGTFNEFAAKHPWVQQENIRPKSIAREMYETYKSFSEYIDEYDLKRTEGVLLRYLTQAYKVLVQTVPDTAKTEPVREMEVYFGAMIRGIDSSLLDEWEKMRDPNWVARETGEAPPEEVEEPKDITRDREEFIRLCRNVIFHFLRAMAVGDFTAAAVLAGAPEESDENKELSDKLESWMNEYLLEHERIMLDPAARNKKNTIVAESDNDEVLRIEQIIYDPDELNDWRAVFDVDLVESRKQDEPVMRLTQFGTVETMSKVEF